MSEFSGRTSGLENTHTAIKMQTRAVQVTKKSRLAWECLVSHKGKLSPK